MITCIAAFNSFFTIGKDGSLPWHSKEDLKHFKNYTMGKDLLMGRVTYEGLPKSLQGRNIYVYTRDESYPNSVQNLENFLAKYKHSDKELVICGGAQLYSQSLAHCDKLVLSYIKSNNVVGDTFFPAIPARRFELVHEEQFDDFDLMIYSKICKTL